MSLDSGDGSGSNEYGLSMLLLGQEQQVARLKVVPNAALANVRFAWIAVCAFGWTSLAMSAVMTAKAVVTMAPGDVPAPLTFVVLTLALRGSIADRLKRTIDLLTDAVTTRAPEQPVPEVA